MKLVRPHSPTQYLRIFVIVHVTSFFISKSVLDSYYHKTPSHSETKTNVRSFREKLATSGIPSYANASETLNRSRTQAIADRSGPDTQPPPPPPPPPPSAQSPMAPRGKGENTKKAAGQARKADAAAGKQRAAEAVQERQEEDKWNQGSKSSRKAQEEADKKAAQAAAKAERERLLAEEEKALPAKPKSAGAKKAEKKVNDRAAVSRGTLNLDQLDDDGGAGPADEKTKRERTLNATGIDNALDALSLTQNANALQIDKHPERRFKAAYAAFEARRLPEIEAEHPGLRRNQRVELCRKEFEKSEDNPFNQAGVGRYDLSKEELENVRRKVRDGVEGVLGEK